MNREMTILEKVIEEEELMGPGEEEEEKKWTEEFQRRRTELTGRQKKSEERKKRAYKKIEELSSRWKRLEQRRGTRVNDYLQRMATTLEQEKTTKQRENTVA